MTKLGVFIAFLGWLTSMEGYTLGHIVTIVLGLSLIGGGLYLGRR